MGATSPQPAHATIGGWCLSSLLDLEIFRGQKFFTLITCPPTSAASAAVLDDSHPRRREGRGPIPIGFCGKPGYRLTRKGLGGPIAPFHGGVKSPVFLCLSR